MLRVANNRVVSIEYTLKSDDGTVLDTSEGSDPLSYLHGVGGLIPGLEDALKGKKAGDDFQVSIAPAEAYGEIEPKLIQKVDRKQFSGVEDLEVGMQFRVSGKGGPRMVRVMAIEGDQVTVDGNHELAGMTLHFSVVVKEVRDATPEEIQHGHAHGPGGHHHH
jgi:FKBP-type peptidyl-prolyl cis-trans isomerase SlyD